MLPLGAATMSEPPGRDPAGSLDVEAHAEQSPLLGHLVRPPKAGLGEM